MAVKLDLYRIFGEVARCRSFSKAAKALYMTQPAVSQAMIQLEEALGMRLFTRTPKGAALTAEGEVLAEYIHSAISLIHVGEEKMKEVKGLMTGELKIGVGDTISRYFLLPYLDRFHQSAPNIKLKIINRTTPELCLLLKSGEADIAICNLPVLDPSLETAACMDVHDIFVCGDKYRDELDMPLELPHIAGLPLILLEMKSNSRQYVDQYFASKGIRLAAGIELGSHDLLLEFARYNLGVACVIREFSKGYLDAGLLYEVPLKEPIPSRSIGFCFLRSVSLSPAASRFVEIVLR